MRTRVLIPISVALLQFISVLGWSASTLPNPVEDPASCGTGISGRVCSPDGLLDKKYIPVIQRHMNSIYEGEVPYSRLFCPANGQEVPIELMATVVSKVEGDKSDGTRVMRFAKGIHERFEVGTNGCGNGAVVVISVEDRQVRLLTL
jgi:hypothetical protein